MKDGQQGTLTCNTGQELASKALDLAVRKWHKAIPFEEIENALTKKIHYDANVASVVEAVA
jgi:hypothetical protein